MKNSLILCLLLLSITLSNFKSVSEQTGFLLQEIEPDSTIYNDIIVSKNENCTSIIDEIAVSNQGSLAIRFNNKSVNIYDASANYLYSIYINRSHCGMYFEWEKDILNLYLISTEYQYRIQIVDEVPIVYRIVVSEQSDKKWKELYHSNNGSTQIVKHKQYTYIRTRTSCWRCNEMTGDTEVVIDIIPSIIKKGALPFSIVLIIVIVIILVKAKDNYDTIKKI